MKLPAKAPMKRYDASFVRSSECGEITPSSAPYGTLIIEYATITRL
jgi:hypothetical protein